LTTGFLEEFSGEKKKRIHLVGELKQTANRRSAKTGIAAIETSNPLPS
jgi:hypothetical protein